MDAAQNKAATWCTTPGNRVEELSAWQELYDSLVKRPADARNATKDG